jgi:2,4'-dihydroxyacetophenone dioxygenase
MLGRPPLSPATRLDSIGHAMTPPSAANIARPLDSIPPALLAQSSRFPEIEAFGGDAGVNMKVLMANVEGGAFAVRIRFAPGTQLATHAHTGAVYAFTLTGEWSYLEYAGKTPPCRPGDFLYEPPGSNHTLKISDDAGETDVLFIIFGAMLLTDADGTIFAVIDAQWHLDEYSRRVKAEGKEVPPMIVGGNGNYLGGDPFEITPV